MRRGFAAGASPTDRRSALHKPAKNLPSWELCVHLMKTVFLSIAVSFAALGANHAQAPQTLPPPQDFRFKVEKLVGDIPQPMEIEVAPDGRIFFNEYNGAL